MVVLRGNGGQNRDVVKRNIIKETREDIMDNDNADKGEDIESDRVRFVVNSEAVTR